MELEGGLMHNGSRPRRRLTNALTAIVPIAIMTASGCAATQMGASSSTASAEASTGYYIQAVNQRAFRRGYQVRWINPPRDD
jgi:hypothetical protein